MKQDSWKRQIEWIRAFISWMGGLGLKEIASAPTGVQVALAAAMYALKDGADRILKPLKGHLRAKAEIARKGADQKGIRSLEGTFEEICLVSFQDPVVSLRKDLTGEAKEALLEEFPDLFERVTEIKPRTKFVALIETLTEEGILKKGESTKVLAMVDVEERVPRVSFEAASQRKKDRTR